MSGSTFQSLLMEGGEGLPPPEPACEFDPYYNTGPTNDPYWNEVIAMLHFDGDYVDTSLIGATYTTYGVSTTSTNARFGQSLSIGSATTQGLVSPLDSVYDLNSGDFTIELWTRPNVGRPPVTNSIFVGIYDNTGVLEYSISGNRGAFSDDDRFQTYYPTGASTLAAQNGFDFARNFWTHIAFTRQGDIYRIFCDGRLVVTSTSGTYRRSSGTKQIRIGNSNPGTTSESMPGLYDEIRITKGVARYTTNFAFPDTAFPDAYELYSVPPYFYLSAKKLGFQSAFAPFNIGTPAPFNAGKTTIHVGQWKNTYANNTVKVYEITTTGSFTEIGSFSNPGLVANQNCGIGVSDVSIFCQRNTVTTVYNTFEGTVGILNTYNVGVNLGSSDLRFCKQNTTIIFGSSSTTNFVYKFTVGNSTLQATSSDLGSPVTCIFIHNNYVYVKCVNTTNLYILNLSDLTTHTVISFPFATSGGSPDLGQFCLVDNFLHFYSRNKGTIVLNTTTQTIAAIYDRIYTPLYEQDTTAFSFILYDNTKLYHINTENNNVTLYNHPLITNVPRTVLSLRGEPYRQQAEVLYVPGTVNAQDTITYNGEVATATLSDATAVSYGPDGITFVADSTNNQITYTATSKLFPASYYDIVEFSAQVTYQGTLSGTGSTIRFFAVGISGVEYGFGFEVNAGIVQLRLRVRFPTIFESVYTGFIPSTAIYTVRFNKKTQEIDFLLDGMVIRKLGIIASRTDPSNWPITGTHIGPYGQASRAGLNTIIVKDFRVITYNQDDTSGYQPQRVYGAFGTVKSTVQKKFGQSSYFSNNSGSVTVGFKYNLAITEQLQFGTGDFTLDLWAYRLANTTDGRIWTYTSGTSGFVRVDTSGNLDVFWQSSGGLSNNSDVAVIPLNTWVHYAFQRRGTALETYVNGILVNSSAIPGGASSTINPSVFTIGGTTEAGSDTGSFNGYIDEVRLLKGAARYTGNFTPPELQTCDESESPVVIPTSGTEYPRGEAATVQTGQLTLLNHYQPLVGSSTLVRQGGIGLAQYPLPSGNTAAYTVTKTLASSAATTTTVQGRLTWGTDGTFTFVNPENGVGTTTTWLSPTGAGASDEYEFRLEIIDNPNNVVTPYSLPFEQYNEVVIDQIIPAYTDITLTEDEGSKTHTLQLQVDIKPKAGSAVAGQSGYVDSWLLTLNFLLTKPAIPVPVYPDFDSGTKVSSESGNVFTWYFNPNGTITSGTINGTQVGRWIDAFDDVAKAAEYRLVVYSDPLPGGFQRVTPTTLIGANMGTSARVRYVNSGTTGSELYVGFTLRVYPLLTNPRYNEANYFGQYTFTMVIPQISGF